MSTNRDVTRIVRSWLHEDAHEDADRILNLVLDAIDTTPQRRAGWLAWRTSRMNKLALTAAAAATVLVVAVVGYNVLPRLGIVGPGATPSPSPVLLARGNFAHRDWGPVEFEATREGSIVTGRMTIGLEEGNPADPERGFFRVDFHCARPTGAGNVMIGGYSTDGAGLLFRAFPEGTLAAIVLRPSSPMAGQIWAGTQWNLPATQTTDCLAYLNAWQKSDPNGDQLSEIRGTVEFGP